MLRVGAVIIVIIGISNNCQGISRKPEPVHLVLKNVNFHPNKRQAHKNFDIFDFSIYLPRPIPTDKTPAQLVSSFSNGITSRPLKKPKKYQPTNNGAYFQALTGLIPQKLNPTYVPTYYNAGTVPPTTQNVKLEAQKVLQFPQYVVPKVKHFNNQGLPNNIPVPPTPAYILHSTTSKPPTNENEGRKTEIYFGSTVTSNFVPHFEALTATKPTLIGPVSQKPVYETATSGAVAPKPYYETVTAHGIRVERPYNSNYYQTHPNIQNIQNNQKILIHSSPTKELLVDSYVYHDDRYTEPDYDSNNENYQVQEQPQESKKNYEHHPTTTILPFYINVDNGADKDGGDNDEESYSESEDQPTLAEGKQTESSDDGSAKAVANEVRYFQDIFVAQNAPHELEFGHVADTPAGYEERYEKKDMKDQRHQGKVRWTDKNGGYGEHYWDLGHDKKST